MKARYTQISPTGFQCTQKFCEDENEQQYSKLSLFGHIEITVRSYYYKVYEFFLTPSPVRVIISKVYVCIVSE